MATEAINHKWGMIIDIDRCTGCQACVPFCPVDCIEPVEAEKYGIPIILVLFGQK